MKWVDAIIAVLQAENAPMHYLDIANKIIELGYRKANELGATPEATVSAQLSTNPIFFERIDKGVYKLVNNNLGSRPELKKLTETKAEKQKISKIVDEFQRDLLIKNFGMFWSRTNVDWKTMNLLGSQTENAKTVNFKEQVGIYMLHDAREVIYVGQAIKQPISKRLADHCKDRLSGRWDRFSWFGFYGVNEEGELVKNFDKNNFTIENFANAIEALLIEGLEPRQNRKSGNEFGMEFLQREDENLQKEKFNKQILERLLKN